MVAGVAQLFVTTRSHIPATKVAATIAKSTFVDFDSSRTKVEVAAGRLYAVHPEGVQRVGADLSAASCDALKSSISLMESVFAPVFVPACAHIRTDIEIRDIGFDVQKGCIVQYVYATNLQPGPLAS
jgi:hypothetical protein